MRGWALALVLVGVATIAWLEEIGLPRLYGQLSRGFKVVPPSLLLGSERPAEGESAESFVRRAVASHCPTCTVVLEASLPYRRHDPADYEIYTGRALVVRVAHAQDERHWRLRFEMRRGKWRLASAEEWQPPLWAGLFHLHDSP